MRSAAFGGALALCFALSGLAHAQSDTSSELDRILSLVQTDPVAALPAAEALAQTGDAEALNLLSTLLFDPPQGAEPQPVRAMALLEEAVQAGSVAAQVNLGGRLLRNTDKADDVRAVELLQAASNAPGGVGADLAAHQLGLAYLLCAGVSQDETRGVELLRRAVAFDPRNRDAHYWLSRSLEGGWGVAPDDRAAMEHLTLAGALGDARAQWVLGMKLLDNANGQADPVAAYALVRASAEQGYGPGMVSHAVMLATGEGVAPDPAQARGWYELAGATGSAHALRGLGMMLLTGEGGPPDEARGAALLALAAEAREPMAVKLTEQFAAELAAIDPGSVRAERDAWIQRYGAPTH